MSISSCPQCKAQVTIPAGLDVSTQVRCPLCRSQYALSDALMNLPPLLEVVVEAAPEPAVALPLDLPDAPLHLHDAPLDPLDLDAAPAPHQEIEHDDFVMQEKDTEIEEAGQGLADPLVRDVPTITEQIDVGEADDSIFESASPSPPHDAPAEELALDFEEFQPAAEPTGVAEEFVAEEVIPSDEFAAEEFAAEEISLDDESLDDADSEAATIEFSGARLPAAGATDEPEMALDFGESASMEASADGGEEIEMDFGEPIATEPTPMAAADEATDEDPADGDPAAKKKKKKPAREPKPPVEGRRRRPIATLVSLLLSVMIALPLTLYGMLWLSPSYDFFKVGGMLPKWSLPTGFNKTPGRLVAQSSAVSQPEPQPNQREPQAAQPEPSTVQPEAPVGQPQPAADATPAGSLPVEGPSPPASESPSAPVQSETPPAESAPSLDAPVDSFPEPSTPPAADKPEEMPDDPLFAPSKEATDSDATDKPTLEEPVPAEPDAGIAERDSKPQPVTAAKPTTDEGPDPFAPAEDAKPEETLPEPAAESLGPVNAGDFTLADLAHAVQNASAADAKMVAAQGDKNEAQFKKIRSNYYTSLFRLAEVLTLVKDEARGSSIDAQRQQVGQAVLPFVADQKRLDALKFNAGKWLGFSKRTTPGIVIAGTVESIEQVGKLHQLKISTGTSADAPTITVVQAKDPQLAAGDQAFVLGVIVDDPSLNLTGYEGDEPTVVWSGVAVQIPVAK